MPLNPFLTGTNTPTRMYSNYVLHTPTEYGVSILRYSILINYGVRSVLLPIINSATGTSGATPLNDYFANC
jgi:hypothetical protein